MALDRLFRALREEEEGRSMGNEIARSGKLVEMERRKEEHCACLSLAWSDSEDCMPLSVVNVLATLRCIWRVFQDRNKAVFALSIKITSKTTLYYYSECNALSRCLCFTPQGGDEYSFAHRLRTNLISNDVRRRDYEDSIRPSVVPLPLRCVATTRMTK